MTEVNIPDNAAKERLDIHLAAHYNLSRARAKELIEQGLVTINGKIVEKPSQPVNDSDVIAIIGEYDKYVSRGGYKLEKALARFGIDVRGFICADIGSSTGGFTDCLLQAGAAKIYAIDNGTDQLADKLRNDNRVVSMENTDIRSLFALPEALDLITADVSFISLCKILENLAALSREGTLIVCLLKPQFEAGFGKVNKSGIITDKRLHKKICFDTLCDFYTRGFEILGFTFSPIKGGSGNIEYLIYAKRAENLAKIPREALKLMTDKTVGDAFAL